MNDDLAYRRGIEWWHSWFIGLAHYAASASKDPSTQVGAVIVDAQRRVLAMGFNGLPRGLRDTPDRLEDRETKLALTIHAEANALLSLQGRPGLVMYTWPMAPCSKCAGLIIQSGLRVVVAPETPPALDARWGADLTLSSKLLREAQIELITMTVLPS